MKKTQDSELIVSLVKALRHLEVLAIEEDVRLPLWDSEFS